MACTDPSAAQLTLSGRELALLRRQAMARHGKAGVTKTLHKTHQSAVALLTATAAAAPSAEAARKAAAAPAAAAAGCACEGVCGSQGRAAASSAASSAAPATAAAASTAPRSDPRPAKGPASSARLAAMQRRQVRALHGGQPGGSAAGPRPVAAAAVTARPSGRVRPTKASLPAPPKVGESHTLAGRPVTGTMLDSMRKVTGTEAGQCRQVTGTEYLGAEPFALCGTRPQPGAAKVGVTHTLREHKVSGTELGRSARVTGDEPGACRAVTGTEYLAREQYTTVCAGTPPAPPPRKVSVMSTPGGQAVSGAPMERSAKVTGDEHGAARTLTGSAYAGPPAAAAAPAGAAVPPKVAEAGTRAGTVVTGTATDAGPRVTGEERGRCRPITGTDYVGPRQLQAVCEAAPEVVAVAKVGEDRTWRGQPVTGTQVGRGERVTGDEPGGCAPISGTPYIGRRQFDTHCEAPQRALQQARLPQPAPTPPLPAGTTIAATAVTGDRPGAGGPVITGDERGACSAVSGTPYVGPDNAPSHCPPASTRYLPRARAPVEVPATPAPADFSIRSPARQAGERGREASGDGAITGSALDAPGSRRITGPVNKAAGLITGTPEFRHSEAVVASEAPAPAAAAATRLTGEGSQGGIHVGGDAWQSTSRVSGTEGASSLARNPSQRGEPRGMGMNAMRMRERAERAELPPSPVTGSAGNTARGAAVTVSGGARA